MDQTSSEGTRKNFSFLVSHSELAEIAMIRKEDMLTKPGVHYYILKQQPMGYFDISLGQYLLFHL
jgi:hypothetical protein